MNNQKLRKDNLSTLVGAIRWWSIDKVTVGKSHLKVRMRDSQTRLTVTDVISNKADTYNKVYIDAFGDNVTQWAGQGRPGQLYMVNEKGKSYAKFIFYDPFLA